jgi:hypothetical protein
MTWLLPGSNQATPKVLIVYHKKGGLSNLTLLIIQVNKTLDSQSSVFQPLDQHSRLQHTSAHSTASESERA